MAARLAEFLQVYTHEVLFHRNIYTPASFTRRRVYGISVSVCAQADVLAYIRKYVNALQELWMKGGGLYTFAVLIVKEENILERFVVRFSTPGKPDFVIPNAMEESFKMALLKLKLSRATLGDLSGAKFRLSVEFENKPDSINAWVPDECTCSVATPSILPGVRYVDQEFKLFCHAEKTY